VDGLKPSHANTVSRSTNGKIASLALHLKIRSSYRPPW
jgi:hypothetical protein